MHTAKNINYGSALKTGYCTGYVPISCYPTCYLLVGCEIGDAHSAQTALICRDLP